MLEEKFLNEEAVKVFNGVYRVGIERQDSQALVMRKTLYLRDVVAVKDQGLEVGILVGVLNFIDKVSCVVNELKVGRGVEIKSSSYLVPCCLKFNHVLKVGEVFQVDQFVV